MDDTTCLAQIEAQSQALRAAALRAGPHAPAPTCPGWTIHRLVTHTAVMHAWVGVAIRTPAGAKTPPYPEPPQAWQDALDWWELRRAETIGRLRQLDPDTSCWAFRGAPQRVGLWLRRQAHETAIHRLDAEFALARSTRPDAVPTPMFPSEFAADGIDELFEVPLPVAIRHRAPIEVSGQVLFHAADARRTWQVTITKGKPLEIGPADDSGSKADTTVAGTADAIYRLVWGRPSTAVVTGDTALLAPLSAP
ncbi:MAG: maleylpyruvate isomerase family mycothiol-dependent enzyme [Sciscionella sp.]